MPSVEHPEHDDLRDVQGNLAGFNKDHQRFLFINFPDEDSGRRFLAVMADEVNHAEEVREFNAEYKRRVLAGEDTLSVTADWVNLGLSFEGLTLVGASGLTTFPQEFQLGMRARATVNGDVDASDPTSWVAPFTATDPAIHAVLIVAADLPDLLDERTTAVRAKISAAGVSELASQDGNVRPAPFVGHEHFGFKDGVSQPNVPHLTSGSKGGPEIAAGEFLIGYEDQDGNISGGAVPQPPQPTQPGQDGYPAPTPTPPAPLPPWTRNGSFVVYRRLRQDVAGFNNFITQSAPTLNLSGDQLGAKLVGRWKSGAPLEHVPGEPAGFDPTAQDPADVIGETVLADNHINDFGYLEHDADGDLTPRPAHIRKTWPRDEAPPGAEEGNRHRMIRRGIVYGPEFQETEPPYPGNGPVPDTQDRGLLFLCYQSSIARGFEFVQQSWANTVDFPEAADGVDPIISQNNPNPPFPLPANPHLTTQRWVTTTGGEYFFSPSISAIRSLGTGSA